jgi:hypothetical protein
MESTCAAGQDGLGACCRLPSRCAGCIPPSTNTHSSGGLRSTQREDAHIAKDAGETQRQTSMAQKLVAVWKPWLGRQAPRLHAGTNAAPPQV